MKRQRPPDAFLPGRPHWPPGNTLHDPYWKPFLDGFAVAVVGLVERQHHITPAGKFDGKAVLGLARMAAEGGRWTTAYLLTALNPALTNYPASALAGTFVKPSEAAAQQQPTLFGARGESRLLIRFDDGVYLRERKESEKR